MRFAGLRPLIDRRKAHPGHQPANAMAPYAPAVATQMPRHLPRAVPGRLQELLVDETHQHQVLGAVRRRLAVERGAADRHQLATGHIERQSKGLAEAGRLQTVSAPANRRNHRLIPMVLKYVLQRK